VSSLALSAAFKLKAKKHAKKEILKIFIENLDLEFKKGEAKASP